MATIHEEMVSAILAGHLEGQLASLDDEDTNGSGTFFAPASNVMGKGDFKKLVSTARMMAKKLRKDADGCPSKIYDWPKHYGA